MAVVSLARGFDKHRNTSRVFPVDPGARAELAKATAAFKRSDPALYQWIVDGHPSLSEAEHVERFGEPYVSRRSKRR